MNFFQNLNAAINYIECNLFEEEIDLNIASRILGTSVSNFKNAFSLLTGTTVNEYIKNRRLSECIRLLQKEKLVDVAIACGFDSRAGFSRAFKNFHGFNPSKLQVDNQVNYYKKIVFNEKELDHDNIKLKIVDLGKLVLYGNAYEIKNSDEIENVWTAAKQRYDKLRNSDKHYGLLYKKDNGAFLYYVALDTKFDNSNKEIRLPSAKCLSTLFNSKQGREISTLSKSIKSKNIRIFPDIEIYTSDAVELLYKI